MISTHPYNIWPLQIKLFTEEAVKFWDQSCGNSKTKSKAAGVSLAPLPPQFSYTIELEGVDGRSGYADSKRTGPISVRDGMQKLNGLLPAEHVDQRHSQPKY